METPGIDIVMNLAIRRRSSGDAETPDGLRATCATASFWPGLLQANVGTLASPVLLRASDLRDHSLDRQGPTHGGRPITEV